jgi:beta-lactam-binding protein with PASTA domain
MNFFKFLISKTFFKNLLAAIVLTVVVFFGLKFFLNSYTHHNEYHLVPDLQKKSIEEAERILESRKMNLVVIDTVDYNPKFPKYSIIEQNPRKDDKVKVGRKIYVKINSDAYANVTLPKIIGKTERQAKTLLRSSGFKIGKITTRPYFAEIVLYALHGKDSIKGGDKIPKTSSVDLIIGDGKRPIDGGASPESEENVDENIKNTLNNVIGN